MRLYRLLLRTAFVLALTVIPFGAYVRLSDAGLGCPDWPGCYGHLIGVPQAAEEQASAQAAFPQQPVNAAKAWKEVLHRYLAGSLALLIVALTVQAAMRRQQLAHAPTTALLLLGVVVAQALLGMLTVTSLLKPLIVSAHLLGGMLTLSLLSVLGMRATHGDAPLADGLRRHAALALFAVVVQIALGGWVSSNYAGLACSDFPTCHGTWWPEMDFTHAFQLHRPLGETRDGKALSLAALLAIQWTHRLGALLVGLIVGALAARLWRQAPDLRSAAIALAALLVTQLLLGIVNVLAFLPLPVAVAHTLGAALLLAHLLTLNLRLWRRRLPPPISQPGADRQMP